MLPLLLFITTALAKEYRQEGGGIYWVPTFQLKWNLPRFSRCSFLLHIEPLLGSGRKLQWSCSLAKLSWLTFSLVPWQKTYNRNLSPCGYIPQVSFTVTLTPNHSIDIFQNAALHFFQWAQSACFLPQTCKSLKLCPSVGFLLLSVVLSCLMTSITKYLPQNH